ncbi:MAG: energy transducer TonB [Bacteroidales bacterium]|nr:energy transducer TonB [Candidatus Scybalocola fimicaballi]
MKKLCFLIIAAMCSFVSYAQDDYYDEDSSSSDDYSDYSDEDGNSYGGGGENNDVPDRYERFANLYPGCEDNQESEIFSAEKKKPGLILPIFPGGGEVEFSRYVYHHQRGVEVVDSVAPGKGPDGGDLQYLLKGTVVVKVTIDRCGRAVNPEIVKSVHEDYDNEALEIMSDLPIFKPGEIDGIRVKVALLVPVYYNRTHPKKKRPEDEYEYDDSYYGY